MCNASKNRFFCGLFIFIGLAHAEKKNPKKPKKHPNKQTTSPPPKKTNPKFLCPGGSLWDIMDLRGKAQTQYPLCVRYNQMAKAIQNSVSCWFARGRG